MTGNDDRLDEADLARVIEAVRRLGPDLAERVSARLTQVQAELRDARAEVERQRARSDAAERMLAYQLPMVEAELAAERAKVERVEVFCRLILEQPPSAEHSVAHGVRIALAGGEQ